MAERHKMADAHGYPTPLAISPSGPHTHSCILLHGRGSKAEDFGLEFLAAKGSDGKTLKQSFPGFKFIFPTAKERRSIVLNRTRINQWFDIYSLDDPSRREYLQVEGLRESVQFIHQIIRKEVELVGAQNVILGGLSQGCACALHVLLTFEETLGAFVGMSGWLPFQHHISNMLTSNVSVDSNGISSKFSFSEGAEGTDAGKVYGTPAARALNFVLEKLSMEVVDPAKLKCLKVPVFLGHGAVDETVKCTHGDIARSTLEALGMDVEWKLYAEFGHWYKVPDEIDDIRDFVNTTVIP